MEAVTPITNSMLYDRMIALRAAKAALSKHIFMARAICDFVLSSHGDGDWARNPNYHIPGTDKPLNCIVRKGITRGYASRRGDDNSWTACYGVLVDREWIIAVTGPCPSQRNHKSPAIHILHADGSYECTTMTKKYDYGALLDRIPIAALEDGFMIGPKPRPHQIATIVDQHWPQTPTIIISESALAKFCATRPDESGMIHLILTQPLADATVRAITFKINDLGHGTKEYKQQKCDAENDILTTETAFQYFEILEQLQAKI